MIHMNLGSHNPDLSRNHKVLDETFALVERVSTEVSTERAAFTTSSARVPTASAITSGEQSAEGRAAPKSVEYSQIQERCQVSCYNGDTTRENDLPCGQDLVPGSDYCLAHQEAAHDR